MTDNVVCLWLVSPHTTEFSTVEYRRTVKKLSAAATRLTHEYCVMETALDAPMDAPLG